MRPAILSLAAALIAGAVSSAHGQRMFPPAPIPDAVQLVQSEESFRVNQLEEQVRQLNGKVEELNFLLLQLQEKIRQMEEDSELRFQELEDKQSQLPTAPQTSQTPQSMAEGANEEPVRLGKPEPSGDNSTSDANPDQSNTELPSDNAVVTAQEPRALGTLTFDDEGNVVDSSLPKSQRLSGLPGIFNDGVEGAVEAAQFGTTPTEVLAAAKGEMQIRQFKRAEQILQAFLKAWPNDPDVGKAKFFLGESYFWQKEFYRSADSHLDAHNNWPEVDTAPDNLLALGLALAGLNQREVACATYAEVLKQYPEAEKRIGMKVRDEQAAARC
ncbi:MAG: tetratricopeptide repeat protein [Rhizobiaceae bacterium]